MIVSIPPFKASALANGRYLPPMSAYFVAGVMGFSVATAVHDPPCPLDLLAACYRGADAALPLATEPRRLGIPASGSFVSVPPGLFGISFPSSGISVTARRTLVIAPRLLIIAQRVLVITYTFHCIQRRCV